MAESGRDCTFSGRMRVVFKKMASVTQHLSEPEPVEFRLGWRRALLSMLPFALILLSSAIAALVLRDAGIEVRWPAVAVLAIIAAVLAAFLSRAVTRVDRNGLVAMQVGRPLGLFRRTAVPWRAVAAIETRRFGRVFAPVVHLADGGWMRLYVPVERKPGKVEAAVGEMRRWHREIMGDDEAAAAAIAPDAAVPTALARPPVRRRALIAVVAGLVIVLDGVLLARQFVRIGDRPPDVPSCGLVPMTLAERLLRPDTASGPRVGPGERLDADGSGCLWKAGSVKEGGFVADATLTLWVYPFAADYLAEEFPDKRAEAEAEHLIHPIAGLPGFTFGTVRSGVAEAEAYVVVGGYRVEATLEQTPLEIGATRARRVERAEAERRVAELVRSVASRLRSAEGRGR